LADLWKKKKRENPEAYVPRILRRPLQPGRRGLGAVCKAGAVRAQGLGCSALLGAAGEHPTGGAEQERRNLSKSSTRFSGAFSEISKHVTAFVVCLSLGLNALIFSRRSESIFLCSLSLCSANGDAVFHHQASKNIRE